VVEDRLPALLGVFEPDHPGMYATPTVDDDIVLQGARTGVLGFVIVDGERDADGADGTAR
jgi:hypothetical protein